MIRRVFCILTLGLLMFTVAAPAEAGSERSARRAKRQAIKNTDILLRPNRPFHFYGNTVRRLYYRGGLASRLMQR